MKSKSNARLILTLNLLWVILLMLLGSWWMYLIVSLGKTEALKSILPGNYEKIMRMLLWEGSAFFILMFLLSGSLFLLYLRDLKKTHSMQAFFASLTHELKTPLASIKLQSEVIHEASEDLKNEKLIRLTKRLIEDTGILESQMDKVLHLSRIERDGSLNLEATDVKEKLKRLIKKAIEKEELQIHFEAKSLTDSVVLIDGFAFEIVMKNLFENTKIHAGGKVVHLTLEELNNEMLCLTYRDSGNFHGNSKDFGELFYRGEAKKGSGIGLYLSKKLIAKMNGSMELLKLSPFTVQILLKKGKAHA